MPGDRQREVEHLPGDILAELLDALVSGHVVQTGALVWHYGDRGLSVGRCYTVPAPFAPLARRLLTAGTARGDVLRPA